LKFKFVDKKSNPYNDDLDDILNPGSVLWKKKNPSYFFNLSVDSKHSYSRVYEIKPDVITKIQFDKDTDRLLGKSPHYQYFPLSDDIVSQLSLSKVEEAKKNPGKEVPFDDGGTRHMNSTEVSDQLPTDVLKPIEKIFQQSSYQDDNHCVWLAAAMLINTEDPERAMDLTNACMKEPQRFQWLRLMNKGVKKDTNTLSNCLRYIKSNYQVRKIRGINSQKINNYIMNEAKHGLYIVTLEDDMGQKTHSVGIDAETRLIYDCLEKCTLPLSLLNLSRCCGDGRTFITFRFYGEIRKH
jgi:hypothetical protein